MHRTGPCPAAKARHRSASPRLAATRKREQRLPPGKGPSTRDPGKTKRKDTEHRADGIRREADRMERRGSPCRVKDQGTRISLSGCARRSLLAASVACRRSDLSRSARAIAGMAFSMMSFCTTAAGSPRPGTCCARSSPCPWFEISPFRTLGLARSTMFSAAHQVERGLAPAPRRNRSVDHPVGNSG